MKFSKYIIFIILLSGITALVSSCSYSFTGASVPPHLKSVAIPLFDDRSSSAEPNLREDFTNELIQKFIDDNTLQKREKVNSDALIEGTILSLADSPTSVGNVQGTEAVTVRRITINVKVIYKDFVKRETIFEKNFSNYGDYNNEGDITAARQIAIQKAIDKITEDILLAVVSNW